MILLFALIAGVHAAPAAAPATQTVIHVRPHGVVGQARQFTLSSRKTSRRDVHVLAAEVGAVRPARRVIPASLARQIDAEIKGWRQRLARAPRGLASLGCADVVEINRGARRTPLCLANPRARREFLSWYDRVTHWLE